MLPDQKEPDANSRYARIDSSYVVPEEQRLDGPLLVLIPDALSVAAEKGVIVPRYYNPGNLFRNVHILQVAHSERFKDDLLDINLIQDMVGTASLTIHKLLIESGSFRKTFGWNRYFLQKWMSPVFTIIKTHRPVLMRAHVPHLNALVAAEIKKRCGIPLAISLHINQDEDVRGKSIGWQKKIYQNCLRRIEKYALHAADISLPVYEPIVPYLQRLKIYNYKVSYNVIDPSYIHCKEIYNLSCPVKLISVGRQFSEKDPRNIIKALVCVRNAELTLVGDGPLHEDLVTLAHELGVSNRVHFIKSLANKNLCAMLPDFDLFVVHSEHWELSKAVLEPLLTGLPVIINRRKGKPVPELEDNNLVHYVENSSEGYAEAIDYLLKNPDVREAMGRYAREKSSRLWGGYQAEKNFVDIYRKLVRQ